MNDPATPRGPLVCLVKLDGPTPPAALELCFALLNDAERTRAGRFVNAEAREHFIVTRATLRRVLSQFAAVAPRGWHFDTGQHGKPHIASPTLSRALEFNVSHTPGLIACAVSTAGRIGIDVERIRPTSDAPLRLMSPEERVERSRFSATDRDRHFFAIWTAKEAYAKAIGTGISDALRTITVRNADTGPELTAPNTDFAHWQLHRLDVGPSHAAVFASESSSPPDIHWHCPSDALPPFG